ncbi:MAG: CDP-alcohol phosphatidyltransferase family protein [Flavobacteriales bacterium]|nr:CDP-alcohol phosphatidyltransferase family protein [Flavobacteriales bacterium]
MNTPQSKEPPVAVTPDSKALAEWFIDPLNRFYRYPLCSILVRPLIRTPLTPNHVTAAHVAVALLSAWFVTRGSATDLIMAALLFELRNILDCLDGTLARAKKTSSLHGAVIDELADAAGVIALLAACGYHLYVTGTAYEAIWSTIAVFILSVLMAGNYVLQKNRFHAPLATGVNEVELKLHERYRDAKAGRGAFFPNFVLWVEKIQNAVAIPGQYGRMMANVRNGSPLDRRETGYLIRRANDPKLWALILLLSVSTGEYVVLILQLGLLMDDVSGAFQVIIVFATVAFAATTALGNLYLTKAYR